MNVKLLTVVNSLLADLPEGTRKAIYKGAKWVAALAFVAFLVVSNDTMFGLDIAENVEDILDRIVGFFLAAGLLTTGATADANVPVSGEVIEDDDSYDGHAEI